MFPDLFSLGPIEIKTYGACMALGFILSWKVIEKISGRKDLGDLLLYLMVSGVVGSRIAYVIEHWSGEFAEHPAEIVRVDKGGLVFYGGLILSIAVFFLWCKIKKMRPLELANLLTVVIPLGHACGRVGCFFYGCCWGKISDSPLAVSFPRFSPAWYDQVAKGLIQTSAPSSLPVLPTQLFEAAALLALFALLICVYLKCRRYTAGLYLVGYAATRFGMEFLRGDPRASVFVLSIGQTISVAMAVLGVAFMMCERKGRA